MKRAALFAVLVLVVVVWIWKQGEPGRRLEKIDTETRKALRHKFDSDPRTKGTVISSLKLEYARHEKYTGFLEVDDPDGLKIKLIIEVADMRNKIFLETKPDPNGPKADIANLSVERMIRKALGKPTGELTQADLTLVTRLNGWSIPPTDATLKEVGKLENFTNLHLGSTQITDTGLKEVAKLKKLEELRLGSTRITDAGLNEVAKLEKLTKLYLPFTQITDAGLNELTSLSQLVFIDLSYTKVTKSGVSELQKALPQCNIADTTALGDAEPR